MDFSVEELIHRLSKEQIENTLDSISDEIRKETGNAVNLPKVISSLVQEMIKAKGLTLKKYAHKPSIADSDENVAVETICRILNPPKEKKSIIGEILDLIWPKRKKPPKIVVVEVEPLPPENLEVLKSLVKKAALRKLKELEDQEKKKKAKQ